MSPAASRDELLSTFVDEYGAEKLDDQLCAQLNNYVDQDLAERGGRLRWDATVMRIAPGELDDPVHVFDSNSPDRPRAGLATSRMVTCIGCRRHSLLQVLALARAAIRVKMGIAKPVTKVPPRRVTLGVSGSPDKSPYCIRDGRLVIDLEERLVARPASS